MFLYSTRVETWKPIGFLRVSGGDNRARFPSISEPFYFSEKIHEGICIQRHLTVSPHTPLRYLKVSCLYVAEGRGETAAFFRCNYNKGLELCCLLALLNPVPVFCTSPVDLQLIANFSVPEE
jgi:hypothetical protein